MRRTTVVWLGLVIATCVTWWLGSDHPFASSSVRLASAVALAIALAKAFYVGNDFMEIRHAPRFLRVAFAVWLASVSVLLLGLYTF